MTLLNTVANLGNQWYVAVLFSFSTNHRFVSRSLVSLCPLSSTSIFCQSQSKATSRRRHLRPHLYPFSLSYSPSPPTHRPKFIIFRLVDFLSCKEKDALEGTCWVPVGTDGYYIMCSIGAVFGVYWFYQQRDVIESLQVSSVEGWRVSAAASAAKDREMSSLKRNG